MLNRVKNHGGALLLLHLELSDQEKIILVASSRIVFRKKRGLRSTKYSRKTKNEKKLHGFSYTKNMANFEVFLSRIKLSANLLFMRSEVCNPHDITQILPSVCLVSPRP